MAFKSIPVNSAKVSGSHSSFPALVRPSQITGIGALSSAEAASVRFYADAAKVTELPREVVADDEIWVKISSLTTTTVIYIDYDGIRSDYAVTDTYGRNAVWSDYFAVWHLTGAVGSAAKKTDSTGNGWTITENTSPNSITDLFNTTDGAYNNDGLAGQTSSNAYDWLSIASMMATLSNNNFTCSIWYNPDIAFTIQQHLLYEEDNGSTGRKRWGLIRYTTGHIWMSFAPDLTASIDSPATANADGGVGTWNYAVGRRRGSDNKPVATLNANIASQGVGATASTTAFAAGNNALFIGRRYNSTYGSARRYFDGSFAEARVRNGDVSDDWIVTEYNNQGDISNFWGTASDVGGGVTTQKMNKGILI